MKTVSKVILLIENSRQFGRDLQRGIARYAALHGPWNFYNLPPFFVEQSRQSQKLEFQRLKTWGANGAIMRDIANIDEVEALGIPMIVSSNTHARYHGLPNLLTDDYEVGKLAAEHLLERGYRYYGFVDYYDFYWSQARWQGFGDTIRRAGYPLWYYRPPRSRHQRLWDIEQQAMMQWLLQLPRPIGLMACIDERAQNVIEACRQVDIKIPEEVAIVGGDNDELICELSNPQLSSVRVDGMQAGYEAAALLDRLMQGETPKVTTVPVHATGVVVRHSTDILAVNDKEVAEALQFIRASLSSPIQVADVAGHCALTRQGLNKKFKKTLGRSIHQEIALVRIQQIKRLLLETNMTISDIARTVGRMELKQLSRFFKKYTDLSPLQYRRRHGHK